MSASEPPRSSRLSRRYPRATCSTATRDFPAPGIPMTTRTSPSPFGCDGLARIGARRSRSPGSRRSVAARADDRAVSGRRAPGMATTFGPRPRSQASATSACVAWWALAMLVNTSWRSSLRARRGPPSGECAITVIPSSAQRSTTPPRSARSSKGLIATWTAAIGASSTASSSWVRLTLQTPMRATRPSSTSRASARIDVGHGVRGSGAWRR